MSLRINKAAQAQAGGVDIAGELAAVNAFAKTELAAEEVYIFSVVLCDNEIDRDYERFTERTLEELRELFVGVTGIHDHEWKSGNQKARIYRTELLRDEERTNGAGLPYMYLKGHAYMLRTESNAELIAEIEGGIKRETSVGCSVARSICSICGEELGASGCVHEKGRIYDGVLCYAKLEGAQDAYEWSFVAVPAQKRAGVSKRFGVGAGGLKAFVCSEAGREFHAEYEKLFSRALAGDAYRNELAGEAARLSLLCDRDIHASLRKSIEMMGVDELRGLIAGLSNQLEKRFPQQTQIPGRDEVVKFESGEYLV